MEIPGKGPLHSPHAQNRAMEETRHTPSPSTDANQMGGEADTVNLTKGVDVFKEAVQRARSLPEIREDRIWELRRRLESGTYRVEGENIATRMINETMENNEILNHIDTKT